MKLYVAIILSGLLLALSAGCRRSRYYHLDAPAGASVRIEFDWDGYVEIPPGMNLVFYPVPGEDDGSDGNTHPVTMQLQYDGGKVSLPAGTYNVAVYSDYTYDIYYRGMDDFLTAEAYLQDYDRLPLATRFADTRNVAEPDIYYVAQIKDLTLSPKDKDRVVVVRPELVTLTLYIHALVGGIANVKMSDGGVSGIASSVMLATGAAPDASPSNILFPFEIRPDELFATTRVFLPQDKTEARYTLSLAFLLRNNAVVMDKYTYDVTDQIVMPLVENGGHIPPGGIHIYVRDIVVDDVVSSGGGFDAVIDGWGDRVDIELK